MIGFIDSHAHIPTCKEDNSQIIQEAKENGLIRILNVGFDIPSSRESLQLSKEYDWIDSSFGIHPHFIGDEKENIIPFLQAQSKEKKYCAVGEIGMDKVKSETDIEIQKEWFRCQVAFACEKNYPVIVHNRNADEEVYAVLSEFSSVKGVMHCFSSDSRMAEKFLEIGMHISFSGNITYKNSNELRLAVKMIPDDRLLLETDSPYLTPIPYRGKSLNRPVFVKKVYEKAAECRQIDLESLTKQVYSNYNKLFHGG